MMKKSQSEIGISISGLSAIKPTSEKEDDHQYDQAEGNQESIFHLAVRIAYIPGIINQY
jgi:hypothetical protein